MSCTSFFHLTIILSLLSLSCLAGFFTRNLFNVFPFFLSFFPVDHEFHLITNLLQTKGKLLLEWNGQCFMFVKTWIQKIQMSLTQYSLFNRRKSSNIQDHQNCKVHALFLIDVGKYWTDIKLYKIFWRKINLQTKVKILRLLF